MDARAGVADRDAVAAGVFGLVHGHVGCIEHGLRGVSRAGRGDADADVQENPAAAQGEGIFDCAAESFGHSLGFGDVQIFADHHEFVAAEPATVSPGRMA